MLLIYITITNRIVLFQVGKRQLIIIFVLIKRSVNDFVSFQAAYHQCEIQLVSLSQLYKQEIQFKHNWRKKTHTHNTKKNEKNIKQTWIKIGQFPSTLSSHGFLVESNQYNI